MNVQELIAELAKCDPAAPVFTAEAGELDEVCEEDGEVTLFGEDDSDDDEDDPEPEAIDVPFKVVA